MIFELIEANNNMLLKRIRLLSNIFHPWVVLVPVLASAAYQATGNSLDCFKWTLIAYLPALLLPLLYAKVRATMLSRDGIKHKISRSLVRNEPKQLFIMTGLFGIPSIIILHFFNGPENLLAIMLGCTSVMFIIAIINLKYRASFHLSMVTSMLTALGFLFGPIYLITFLILIALGFSRYLLGEHTPTQMVIGFLIGLVISGTIFYSLGLGV